jgi:hypothetical protein
VKICAVGAIISQLMQIREPYLDDGGAPGLCHRGERPFRRVLECQLADAHSHLGLVLETLEVSTAVHPRSDHRTVIVHFANSTDVQVGRIARVGATASRFDGVWAAGLFVGVEGSPRQYRCG